MLPIVRVDGHRKKHCRIHLVATNSNLPDQTRVLAGRLSTSTSASLWSTDLSKPPSTICCVAKCWLTWIMCNVWNLSLCVPTRMQKLTESQIQNVETTNTPESEVNNNPKLFELCLTYTTEFKKNIAPAKWHECTNTFANHTCDHKTTLRNRLAKCAPGKPQTLQNVHSKLRLCELSANTNQNCKPHRIDRTIPGTQPPNTTTFTKISTESTSNLFNETPHPPHTDAESLLLLLLVPHHSEP